jgi:hypothetical protein
MNEGEATPSDPADPRAAGGGVGSTDPSAAQASTPDPVALDNLIGACPPVNENEAAPSDPADPLAGGSGGGSTDLSVEQTSTCEPVAPDHLTSASLNENEATPSDTADPLAAGGGGVGSGESVAAGPSTPEPIAPDNLTGAASPVIEDEAIPSAPPVPLAAGGGSSESGDATASEASTPAPEALDQLIEASPAGAVYGRAAEAPQAPPEKKKPSLLFRILRILAPAAMAFVTFFFTPMGDLVKGPIVGMAKPVIRTLSDQVNGALGISEINVSDTQAYTGETAVIDDELHQGDEAPDSGCFDSGWLAQRGGVPVSNESLVHISTPRNDVVLVDATLRYKTETRSGKSIVTCMEGGDGAVTIINYNIRSTLPSVRAVTGPGATSDGSGVSLLLSPGEDYPIGVFVSAGDDQVVSWTANLVFLIGSQRKSLQIGSGRVAGTKNLPRFVAENGMWKSY